MGLVENIKPEDWRSVRSAIAKINTKLGPTSKPTFAGLILTTPLTVPNGGTGLATLTDHGLLLGSGTGAITPLAEATDGQIPIGDTDGDPILATITGTANRVTVSNGAGTITLTGPQDIDATATPTFAGLTLSAIAAEATDVDKFLVDSTGVIKYRTGVQVLSDIGASASGHTHDGDTLQLDGINSNGGAFAFTTTGDVTFDENVILNHLALGGAAIDPDYGLVYEEVLTDTDNTAKVGLFLNFQVKKTAAVMAAVAYGLAGTLWLDSGNTQNWNSALAGLRSLQGSIATEAGSSGTITGAACLFSAATIADAATITNLYGLYVNTPNVSGNKVTNEYGLYINDQDTGTTLSYAIYSNVGLVRFGGNITIGNIAAPAESANIHLYRGASGTASYDVNACMFLENSDHCTALIVTPNNKQGIWGFADEDDTFVAGLTYDHSTNKTWIYSNNAVRFTVLADGGIVIPGLKSGITQAAAGAAANELWIDTDDSNTIKIGV